MKKIFVTLFQGVCMGASDIVPGVSGGTIALVFGIYERLLDNVRAVVKSLTPLFRLDFAKSIENFKKIDFAFIIPLLLGIFSAIAVLTGIIENLLKNKPEEIAGFFFGLVLGSILVALGLLKPTNSTGRRNDILVMIFVGILAFFLLGFQSGQIINPPVWAFFFTGAIAICAMILPGISGSFIMLMMGMYAGVLAAVHDLDFVKLGLFLVGAVIGLGLFSKLLTNLLKTHYNLVLSVLVGLMVGSLRVLWPWPNGVGVISEQAGEVVSGTDIGLPDGNFLVPSLLCLLGFVLVFGLTSISKKFESS